MTGSIEGAVQPVAASAGVPLGVTDVVPPAQRDSTGLLVFSVTLGTVLAAYIFALSTANTGRALRGRTKLASATVFSLVLGTGVALLVGPLLGAISQDAALVGVLVTLLAMAVSSGTAFLLALTPRLGSLVASVVFLVLGVATGGLTPAPLLPGWLVPLASVLPNGLAATALRGTAYFDRATLTTGVVGLGAWVLLTVAATAWEERRAPRPTLVAPADQQPAREPAGSARRSR